MDIKNWFKKIFSTKLPLVVLAAALILGGFFAYNAFAGIGPVTPASTTTASIDTTSAGGTGAYTSVVSGPSIQESTAGDIAVGTHTLTLPTGWEFNTGNPISISVDNTSAGLTLEGGWTTITPGTNTITFTVATPSTSPVKLTIGSMQVRPSGTTAPTTGNMIHSGAPIVGVVDGATSFGTFNITVGAPTKINVETAANSPTPVKLGSVGLNAGSGTLTVYSVRRDQFNNFVDNYSAAWTLVSKLGGILDADLNPGSGATASSSTFSAHKVGTAIVHVNGSGFDSDDLNLVTVHPVAPGTPAYQGFTPSHTGYINASEEAGFTIRVTGLGGAVTGDTLELLLGGVPFGTPKVVTLGAGDITSDFVDFSIAHLDLGADGAKSLTSRIDTVNPLESQTSTGHLDFTLDIAAPSGYTVSIDQAYINLANKAAVSFTFAGAEVGATYNYAFSDGVHSDITGTNTVTSATQKVSGIDLSSLNDTTLTLTVTLTDPAGNTGSDATDTVTKDATSPTVTDAKISVSGASGAGGVFIIGDIVTVTWDNTALTGDNNSDIASVTVDFSQFGGTDSVAASNSADVWKATYTIVPGTINGAIGNVSVTATDIAGNPTTTADTTNSTIDNQAPSGYTVSIDQAYINFANKAAVSFTFAGAEVGATYNYAFSDGVHPNITGTNTVTSVTQKISGIDLSSLNDTTLTLTVTLTDPAGNTGASTGDGVLKDTVAPSGYTVSIDQAYINFANKAAVSFTFAGAEVGATYNYAFSDGVHPNITGTNTVTSVTQKISGIDLSSLNDTTLTLTVTLTDPAGNTGANTTDTVTKDTVAPALPTGVTFTSVGGVVKAGYVNTTNTNFTGSATIVNDDANGGYAELLIDGSSFVTPVKDSSIVSGNTTVDFDAGLTLNSQVQTYISSGSHVFIVKLCDAADNCVVSTDNATVNADYVVPTFTSIVFGADAYVNAVEVASGVNLNVTTTDLENGQVVSCTIKDGVPAHNVGPVTGAVGGNNVIIPTGVLTGLNDGSITAYCDVSDLAGNPATQGTQTVTKDTIAPLGYSVDIVPPYVNLANKGAVSFTFAGAEVKTPATTYNFSFDDTDGATAAVTGSGSITSADQTISGINLSSLSDGTLTLTVKLTDVAGNVGGDVTDTVLKDTISPTVSAGEDQTKDALFSQTATATDGGSGVDGTSFIWSKDSGSGNITFSAANALTTNISSDVTGRVHYVLKFTAKDLAGNSANDTMNLYWTNNSLNPIIYNPANGATGVAITAGNATVTFDSMVTNIIDASKINIFKVNDGSSVRTSVAMSGGSIQIGYSTLEYGTTYRISIAKDAVEDASGYMNNAASSTFVTVPAVAPAVTLTNPLGGAIVSGSVTITATNGTEYQIDGGAWVATSTAWNTTLVANGSHTIRAKGGMPTGYSDTITVAVNNGNVPTFTWTLPAPGSTLANTATVGATYTVGNFDSGTVEYSVNGGVWTAAGDTTQIIPVQVGTNTIQLKATKTVGGVATTGYSAINTFQVNPVVDSVAPTITLDVPPEQNITVTSADIKFKSSENGIGKIHYGTTAAYGNITTDQPLVADAWKTVTLSGLACGTTYHYSIFAKDGSNNESSTLDATFMTSGCPDTTAPVINSISLDKPAYRLNQDATITATVVEDNTASSVTINGVLGTESPAGTWTATFPHGKSSVGEYSFNVVVTDASGNNATVLVTYAVIADDAPAAPVVTLTAPLAGSTVSGGSVTVTATNGAYYQIDGGAWVNIGTAWNTTGVSNGTHTVRASSDGVGAPTGYSDIIAVMVNNADIVAPTVSYNGLTDQGLTSAVLHFSSSENGTAYIRYGLGADYGNETNIISIGGGGDNAIALTGLTCGTIYYYNIFAKDVAGNEGNLGGAYTDHSFNTAACPTGDTTPPTISVTTPVVTTQTGATITFTSNETGKGKVAYYLTGITPTETSYVDVTAATSKDIVLADLTCGTTYNYIVYAKDAVGNERQTTPTTFTTAACPNGVLAVNSVSMVKISGTAGGGYEDGWEWVMRVTLPTNEPRFAMKFSNWTSGANTFPAGGNMRYYSEQIGAGVGSIGSKVDITAADTYPEDYATVTEDVDPSRPGIQTDVHIQVSIPSGTPGGSYGASYGLKSDSGN